MQSYGYESVAHKTALGSKGFLRQNEMHKVKAKTILILVDVMRWC